MKGGDSMREIRERTIEVVKEEGFICGKCGAKSEQLADSRDDASIKGIDLYWDEKEQVIACRKCGHQLTSKKELYNYPKIKEIQQYGFWLRFLSEQFIPCPACQNRIHKLIISKEMHIGSEDKPPVELWRRWEMISVEKKPNNAFVEEYCVICARWFNASEDYIYNCLEFDGYACYDCGKKLE